MPKFGSYPGMRKKRRPVKVKRPLKRMVRKKSNRRNRKR